MKTTSELGKLDLAAAIGLARAVGPIAAKIRGLGPKKQWYKRHGNKGHRRVAITGKPWIPSLDLRRSAI